MKIFCIMWSNYIPILKKSINRLNNKIYLYAYSNKQIAKQYVSISQIITRMKTSDLILLYRTHESFWEELEDEILHLKERIPVIVVGPDPSFWSLSSVNPEIVATVYQYLLYSGEDNLHEMLKYLMATLFNREIAYNPPRENLWEGIYHPLLKRVYLNIDEYLRDYPYRERDLVGILYSRSNWVTQNIEVEKRIISALEERGLGVVPVFFYSLKDEKLGNLSGEEIVKKFFVKDKKPLVCAVVKLTTFLLGQKKNKNNKSETAGVTLFKELNIPLISPLISYYKTKDEWFRDKKGLGEQVAWSIALPELEGVIEPIVIGATTGYGEQDNDEFYEPIYERISKLAQKIDSWIKLSKKANSEKKVVFILHNNPCASVEATVGGGAHLDTLESIVYILKKMKAKGYMVGDIPESGKDLIDIIMERKAISEFRWTTIEEIVKKGGALELLDTKKYLSWFKELPESTQKRIVNTWGEPPGEAMVYKGRIVITGIRFGNILVCVQPKRGCAGSRCDGKVCKILHDPDIPPPHQYIATYKWFSRKFKTDIIIHVGTHGNLEFLPGKSTGLSAKCLPDINIDSMCHLYIYNSDNSPEGVIAKRRSLAVLIDHMQTIMVDSGLYGELDDLDKAISEYEKVKDIEPAKAHFIGHRIEKMAKDANLLNKDYEHHKKTMDEIVRKVHEEISLIRNSYIPKGMHVFGKIPKENRLADFIFAIIRYRKEKGSLIHLIESILSKDNSYTKLSSLRKKEFLEKKAKEIVKDFITKNIPITHNIKAINNRIKEFSLEIKEIEKEILDIKERILGSDEMGSLFNGMNGGYIEPGPSGIVTRGKVDVLPSGRNFYSLDPRSVPSKNAWEIGKILADKTLERYLKEEHRYPENIAFYWQASDIMWADGEGMAQIMYLLGVEPVWKGSRVEDFRIIPLPELKRPRIDVTIRVSGIIRDNFPCRMELLDAIIVKVAALEEPLDMNFVKKHTLKQMKEKFSFREATYRIFCSMPGVYQAGTQLAVYASAWKDEKDLAETFLYWNGYAYGKGVFGEQAHKNLKENLRSVELSFNKTVTDEYDLFGCCCYFGTHGGLINAAKVVSKKEIKSYYGDTRTQGEVEVRSLSEEIKRVVRTKLLNPKWIEGMKSHGYKGAGDISKRIGRVYGWQATSREVDNWIFDEIARTYLMDEENRDFFEKNNPYALEEIARRLIEAAQRGLWKPAEDVAEKLKELYVEIEGWIEEKMEGIEGEFQGGAIDVISSDDVKEWKEKLQKML